MMIMIMRRKDPHFILMVIRMRRVIMEPQVHERQLEEPARSPCTLISSGTTSWLAINLKSLKQHQSTCTHVGITFTWSYHILNVVVWWTSAVQTSVQFWQNHVSVVFVLVKKFVFMIKTIMMMVTTSMSFRSRLSLSQPTPSPATTWSTTFTLLSTSTWST